MYEWYFTVQKLIDWIDNHAIENHVLKRLKMEHAIYVQQLRANEE